MFSDAPTMAMFHALQLEVQHLRTSHGDLQTAYVALSLQHEELLKSVQDMQQSHANLRADEDRHGMSITDRLDHLQETWQHPNAVVFCNVALEDSQGRNPHEEARHALAKALLHVPGVTMADVDSCRRLGSSRPGRRPAPLKVVFRTAAARQKAMDARGLHGMWVKPYITRSAQRARQRLHARHIQHLQRLGVSYHWRGVCDLRVVWPDGSREQWHDGMLHLQEVPADRQVRDDTPDIPAHTYAAATRRRSPAAAAAASAHPAAHAAAARPAPATTATAAHHPATTATRPSATATATPPAAAATRPAAAAAATRSAATATRPPAATKASRTAAKKARPTTTAAATCSAAGTTAAAIADAAITATAALRERSSAGARSKRHAATHTPSLQPPNSPSCSPHPSPSRPQSAAAQPRRATLAAPTPPRPTTQRAVPADRTDDASNDRTARHSTPDAGSAAAAANASAERAIRSLSCATPAAGGHDPPGRRLPAIPPAPA